MRGVFLHDSIWAVIKNYGPFLGTLNIRCRIKIGIQKWTIILTTTHMNFFETPLRNAYDTPGSPSTAGAEASAMLAMGSSLGVGSLVLFADCFKFRSPRDPNSPM